jgi:hypothetical protein
MRHVKDKLFSHCRRVVCLVDNLDNLIVFSLAGWGELSAWSSMPSFTCVYLVAARWTGEARTRAVPTVNAYAKRKLHRYFEQYQ